ncbi:MAG: hypothetical protein LBM23_00715 [Propionibacteriaceae bacterium]|jgi:hypothetical protein|nr:hypothetical protein [Propionibacteriaceae bacterium]
MSAVYSLIHEEVDHALTHEDDPLPPQVTVTRPNKAADSSNSPQPPQPRCAVESMVEADERGALDQRLRL